MRTNSPVVFGNLEAIANIHISKRFEYDMRAEKRKRVLSWWWLFKVIDICGPYMATWSRPFALKSVCWLLQNSHLTSVLLFEEHCLISED